MEAVRSLAAHFEAPLTAGIVCVRYPLLYRFPFKLGEHDTDTVSYTHLDVYKRQVKWIEKDSENVKGKIVALPTVEDIDLPIEVHLIVELYSK